MLHNRPSDDYPCFHPFIFSDIHRIGVIITIRVRTGAKMIVARINPPIRYGYIHLTSGTKTYAIARRSPFQINAVSLRNRIAFIRCFLIEVLFMGYTTLTLAIIFKI